MRHEPSRAERARRRKTALLSWARVNRFGPLHLVPDNAEHWRQIQAVAADLGLETTTDEWAPAGGEVEAPAVNSQGVEQTVASLGPTTPAEERAVRIYEHRRHGKPWDPAWGPHPDLDDDGGKR